MKNLLKYLILVGIGVAYCFCKNRCEWQGHGSVVSFPKEPERRFPE